LAVLERGAARGHNLRWIKVTGEAQA